MNQKNVIIYRDSLLPGSETFIQQQTFRLKKFIPYYVGYKKVKNGLTLPTDQVIVHSSDTNPKNKLSEVLLKKWGWNPFLLAKMKKVNPSLIHAHFGPDGLIASSFSKKLNIPLVVTFHGFDATTKREELLKQAFNTRLYAKNMKQECVLFGKTGAIFSRILMGSPIPPFGCKNSSGNVGKTPVLAIFGAQQRHGYMISATITHPGF